MGAAVESDGLNEERGESDRRDRSTCRHRCADRVFHFETDRARSAFCARSEFSSVCYEVNLLAALVTADMSRDKRGSTRQRPEGDSGRLWNCAKLLRAQ
jgi:hypothetical protein